ncbi:MAG: hypothetical protein ACOC0M_08425, partial [Halomonas sp.]
MSSIPCVMARLSGERRGIVGDRVHPGGMTRQREAKADGQARIVDQRQLATLQAGAIGGHR